MSLPRRWSHLNGAPLATYVGNGEEKVLLTRGRLVRHIPIRLLDLSLSGCLLQTTQPLEAGTTGELQVEIEGKRYREGLFVVRSLQRAGTHASHFGGEFSPGADASQASMRSAVQTIAADRVTSTP